MSFSPLSLGNKSTRRQEMQVDSQLSTISSAELGFGPTEMNKRLILVGFTLIHQTGRFSQVVHPTHNSYLHRVHPLVLPRLDLRLRPVDAVDLRLPVSQRREVVVFGSILETLCEVVLVQVLADLVVPCLSLLDGEYPSDGARPSLSDLKNTSEKRDDHLTIGGRDDAKKPNGPKF